MWLDAWNDQSGCEAHRAGSSDEPEAAGWHGSVPSGQRLGVEKPDDTPAAGHLAVSADGQNSSFSSLRILGEALSPPMCAFETPHLPDPPWLPHFRDRTQGR
jgi:hypothetical protein